MTKKLISIRVSEQVDSFIKKLAENRESTQANIVEEAIRLLAKKEGLIK